MTTTQTATQPTHATIATTLLHSTTTDLTIDVHYVKENAKGDLPSHSELHSLDPSFLTTSRVAMRDVRGRQGAPLTLAANGFEYFQLDFDSSIDYTDEDDIKAKWYPQIEAALKEKLSAKAIITFNHIVRNAVSNPSAPMSANYRGPATRPHLDISSLFGPTVLQDKVAEKILPTELMREYLSVTRSASINHADGSTTSTTSTKSKKHWQILNVWRPLSTVQRDPLGVADAASVRPRDMIHIQLPYKPDDPTAKTEFLRAPVQTDEEPDRKHEWHYMSAQKPEEVLLFRQYDSEGELGLPHTAFQLPNQDDDVPARQSIETRLFAFY